MGQCWQNGATGAARLAPTGQDRTEFGVLGTLVRVRDLTRMDLFYRIAVTTLMIPPLRERQGDVAVLSAHFVAHFAARHGLPAKPLSDDVYPYIDLITPNETETEILTGIKVTDHASAEAAATLLQQKGVKNVIITLGEKGAYLQSADGIKEIIEGFRVDAKDTTAAGDCFNGALTIAISEGRSLKDAVLFANRAAAISVTRPGAQVSMPYRHEVDVANF